jgi:hypothetical protein
MAIDIANKILIFLFFVSSLNVIRNLFFLSRSFYNKERFVLEKQPLLFLAVSIAYILMSIVNGITIL